MILGAFLCLSYQFQTYGLKHTTASKNAFITTLYVIIVPFLYWIVSKKRPTGRNIAAAFLAVIDLALLSLQGDLSINYGDFLTLVCGLMFAHPAAEYFSVGKIGEDQLEDYARRRGKSTEEMRKFLAANLQ